AALAGRRGALALPGRRRGSAPATRRAGRLAAGRRARRRGARQRELHAMREPLEAPRPLADLSAYLELLRAERELVEIDCEVDPDLEAGEVHRRVIAAGGPALLFRRIRGSAWPLATNLFGTRRRVEIAFGRRPEQILRRAAEFARGSMPPSVRTLWRE